jgi:ABC-type branched-subunit amino acid transport system ATPase component
MLTMAQGLVRQPRHLMLDEPSAGLSLIHSRANFARLDPRALRGGIRGQLG